MFDNSILLKAIYKIRDQLFTATNDAFFFSGCSFRRGCLVSSSFLCDAINLLRICQSLHQGSFPTPCQRFRLTHMKRNSNRSGWSMLINRKSKLYAHCFHSLSLSQSEEPLCGHCTHVIKTCGIWEILARNSGFWTVHKNMLHILKQFVKSSSMCR